ncbi:Alkali-sensitive linkage protein 1 [Trametes pubescens]|uniref:Alkali-sensitive linkage protein 1 n=1 Tax=Trametes pubescens TaxID=154538 RepID=A0A1M2VWI2_TRAPU|nr:Alkali-sensitive linkage protein 1 [Trametes pubescens]
MATLSKSLLSVLFGAIVAAPAFAFPAQVDTIRARALNPAFGQPGSKICLSWSEGNDPSLANLKTPHVIGLYDYGVDKPTAADRLGFDFWPLLWGGDASRLAAFDSAVTSGLGTIILGFNEPNEAGQSNLDPFTAAALWRQHIEPKRALGYKTAAPAVSNANSGIPWLKSFIQACGGCNFDYVAVHWYDVGFSNMVQYLTTFHDTFGLPILLTEFAEEDFNGGTQPTSADVLAFMKQAIPFFDETPWILAACPFGFVSGLKGSQAPTALQNADGTPNALGSLVINDGQ